MIQGYSEALEQQASLLFGNIAGWEQSTLQKIGNRINKTGKLSREDVKALNNMAMVKQDMSEITKELAKVTGKNIAEVEKIYGNAIARLHTQNKPLYDYRGKTFVPFEDNRELQALVRAYAKSTNGTMLNLSKTKMLGFVDHNAEFHTLEDTYANVLDRAVMTVASGAEDFHTAMRSTINELGGSGFRVHYGSGITRRLDTVVRQNLLWGAKQASIEYNEMIGEYLGCDGVEVDWHSFPRPSHEFMQGKQYCYGETRKIDGVTFIGFDTKDPSSPDGLSASEALEDYGCKHYKSPIICGISEPRYDAKELANLNKRNNQIFEIADKILTGYEASQAMRQIETEIRKQKDIRELAKSSGDSAQVAECNRKIKAYQSRYKEISDITGIAQEPNRMR